MASLITFSRSSAPITSWNPSVNPNEGGGYAQAKEWFQPKDYSDGGDLYSYSRGSAKSRILEWDALPAEDMDALLRFISIVKGVYTFTFTDYEATSYSSSRVLNLSSFRFLYRTLWHYSVMLEIEVV